MNRNQMEREARQWAGLVDVRGIGKIVGVSWRLHPPSVVVHAEVVEPDRLEQKRREATCLLAGEMDTWYVKHVSDRSVQAMASVTSVTGGKEDVLVTICVDLQKEET